jgi:hypothetical protein
MSGYVSFLDGGTLFAEIPLANRVASLYCSLGCGLSPGVHTLTAQYGGDAQNFPSASGPLQQSIVGTVQILITASGGGQSQTIPLNVTVQ